MAPGDALNGCQPRQGQCVGERVHADVRVEQNVEPLLGDDLAGGGQVGRNQDEAIGALLDRFGNSIAMVGGRQSRHGETVV